MAVAVAGGGSSAVARSGSDLRPLFLATGLRGGSDVFKDTTGGTNMATPYEYKVSEEATGSFRSELADCQREVPTKVGCCGEKIPLGGVKADH